MKAIKRIFEKAIDFLIGHTIPSEFVSWEKVLEERTSNQYRCQYFARELESAERIAW